MQWCDPRARHRPRSQRPPSPVSRTEVRDNVREVSMNGSFGGRIRSLREAMDLSLRDLADRSGVSAPMSPKSSAAKQAQR
jgi:ribosome-binding protein aMBF1 (putative translation factor)